MLHPDNDFNVERTLLKDDVQKLIKVSAYSGRVVGSGGGGRGERGRNSVIKFLMFPDVWIWSISPDLRDSVDGHLFSFIGHYQDAGVLWDELFH